MEEILLWMRFLLIKFYLQRDSCPTNHKTIRRSNITVMDDKVPKPKNMVPYVTTEGQVSVNVPTFLAEMEESSMRHHCWHWGDTFFDELLFKSCCTNHNISEAILLQSLWHMCPSQNTWYLKWMTMCPCKRVGAWSYIRGTGIIWTHATEFQVSVWTF